MRTGWGAILKIFNPGRNRMKKPKMSIRKNGELEATPERVTIYASHPAFGLLHQMHQTERRLYKSDMENKALRESLDATAAGNRMLKARLKVANARVKARRPMS